MSIDKSDADSVPEAGISDVETPVTREVTDPWADFDARLNASRKLDAARYPTELLIADEKESLRGVRNEVEAALRSGHVTLERADEGTFKTGFKDFEQAEEE